MDNIRYSSNHSIGTAVLGALSGGASLRSLLPAAVLIFLLFPSFAETGRWELSPSAIELPGGILLSPGSPGAVGMRGVKAIRFVEKDLAVLELAGQELSAFYSFRDLDAGAREAEFRLADGKVLLVELTSLDTDSRLFLYRIPEDFFPSPFEEKEGDTPLGDTLSEGILEKPEIEPEPELMVVTELSGEADEVETEIPSILITGVMVRTDPSFQQRGMNR